MIEHPRSTGPLDPDPEVRARLAELRLVSFVDTPPELDVDAVRDTERGVGMHLPDDVLALFAAGVPHLADAHEMTLTHVVAHTGTLRALGARGDYVGVGRDPDGARWWAVEKGRSDDRTRLLAVSLPMSEAVAVPLVEFLDGEVRRLREERPDAPRWDPGLTATFEPRLVRRLPESATGIRVRHKTFGEGRVLQELGSGPNRKVKVDFPGKGLKLLQARFLEFLE